MWSLCLFISVAMIVLGVPIFAAVGKMKSAKKNIFNLLNIMLVCVFTSAIVMFFPIHCGAWELNGWHIGKSVLLSIFNAMQIFTTGCEFAVVYDGLEAYSGALNEVYHIWAAILFVVAPVLSFGFVLSLFKNMFAYIKYWGAYFKDIYVFSELNEKSLVLARDIKKNKKDVAVVFTDVFEENEETSFELIEEAKKINAICFKKDILVVKFNHHSKKKSIFFFTIGIDETENLNQSLKLIGKYKDRENIHLYAFSTNKASELLLSSGDKGKMKVRRINEVQSLINRVLYERGEIIFESAVDNGNGEKDISAVVIGMGRHGTEMVRALSWFGQMDGYRLEINSFDKDPLAKEKFMAEVPELMSKEYNGVYVDGEAQYKISVHPGVDVDTISFAEEIAKIKNATYVFVALGDDDANINTAINLRMYFERMNIHPVIHAIVYNPQQKYALQGMKNFKGQLYDIEFIGDVESSYISDVIIDSELEEAALNRHMKWGAEEEFWNFEYNYRSSTASAIHMKARIKCGIPGSDKKTDELTEEERNGIEKLEHRRWNAYMRSEGYIYSGSNDKSSRNDLAKKHHDLVDFSSLPDDVKRIDGQVGTE